MNFLDTLTCGVSTILGGVLASFVYGVVNYQNDDLDDDLDLNDLEDLNEHDLDNGIDQKYFDLAH